MKKLTKMLTVSCIYTQTRQKVTQKAKNFLIKIFTLQMIRGLNTNNEKIKYYRQLYIIYPICVEKPVPG